MLRSYNDINFIMSLEIDDFISLIAKAFEKKEERKSWEMWLTLYPNMTKENFMPFSEFFRMQKEPISKRSKEDILDEVERIRASVRDKGGV